VAEYLAGLEAEAHAEGGRDSRGDPSGEVRGAAAPLPLMCLMGHRLPLRWWSQAKSCHVGYKANICCRRNRT